MFAFYGCSNNTLNTSNLEQSIIVVNQDNINAIVKEKIITSSKESITLILENNTDNDYIYGVDFKLEMELDNCWYEVPFKTDSSFIEIGLILKANSKKEEVIELYNYFNDLPEGKYRIVKTFYLDNEKIVVTSTFKIKKN